VISQFTYAWSTMSSSSMDETVRVRNWPITINFSFLILLTFNRDWSISYSYSLIHTAILSTIRKLWVWQLRRFDWLKQITLTQVTLHGRERPVWPRSRLTTATHSSRYLKAFPCSSAVSGWWSIGTWPNGPHLPWGANLIRQFLTA